jgi:hypothetical protein
MIAVETGETSIKATALRAAGARQMVIKSARRAAQCGRCRGDSALWQAWSPWLVPPKGVTEEQPMADRGTR